ncbi:GrdX family protein [Ihubacter massiliensis]|uniref:GrdX family protein n=1 Tax=Hominibacterium faecale TaxID=2839743 RepID=A0A9J6QSB5_9FIRM|nr:MULTISPECIES: GrdX family protein [Eubacteriales Family XIII. Incertae Sedis]MCC2864427.1 GrdX family protein [Anaerovorax odorimutans]MCO7124050.1 GrdX family protein [Ihubacter massiliensis]MCU7379042.1 GrdX family protein [Hominibacterium faecale]
MLILTNNSKVKTYFEGRAQVIYEEKRPVELLKQARDLIHQGHELLTHPLSGSISPRAAPYKSMALSRERKELDLSSLRLIEEAIRAYEGDEAPILNHPQSILEDFKEVDFALIKGAQEE